MAAGCLRVVGWSLGRWRRPYSYPREARRGPVVGTRTWGGVTGIEGRQGLVDGSTVTVPRPGVTAGPVKSRRPLPPRPGAPVDDGSGAR